jgi:hypothetical protein
MGEGPSVVKATTIRQVVFLSIGKGSADPWNLQPIFFILKRLIFESSVRAGSPSFVAAPDGPETCP